MAVFELPDTFSLRPMVLDDLEHVLTIEQRVYEFPWSKENFTSCLAANYECWILLCDNTPVGHAVLSAAAGEAHLLNISIDEAYQRKGLGRILLRYMLARAEKRDAKVIFLEVRVSNIKAFQLYQSEGFNEIGVRKGYYPAEKAREDAMVLAIQL